MIRSANIRYWKHKRWGTESLYYLSHALWRRRIRGLAKAIKYISIMAFRCYIDCSARIGVRLDLPHGGFGLVIGPNVTIGDDAIILHNVTIGHAKPGPVIIGDRFCAGTGAKILGPLRIGNDVTVGAGAVVTFDVPDGCTVVGQKARIIPPKEQLVQHASVR